MSIRLMSAAWRLGGMNPGAKLVLLALCDNASDEGLCFPSIRRIAEKCCMSERTVQGHIAAFEVSGMLARSERPGRSTVYTIDPRRICTPAESAPPQNLHPTPAVFAPLPPQNLHPTPAVFAPITINEPSREPSGNPKRAQRAPDLRPEDVAEQVWADWCALRKSKKAAVTATALEGIRREAKRAGLTMQQALETCCANGWQGLKAEWLTGKNGQPMNEAQRIAQRDEKIARLKERLSDIED